jgi:hypothetical protein
VQKTVNNIFLLQNKVNVESFIVELGDNSVELFKGEAFIGGGPVIDMSRVE